MYFHPSGCVCSGWYRTTPPVLLAYCPWEIGTGWMEWKEKYALSWEEKAFFFAKKHQSRRRCNKFFISGEKWDLLSGARTKAPLWYLHNFFAFSVYLSSLSRGRQAGALLSSSSHAWDCCFCALTGARKLQLLNFKGTFQCALTQRSAARNLCRANKKRRRRKKTCIIHRSSHQPEKSKWFLIVSL